MRIKWLRYSLEIEQDSVVHVQQDRSPFQVDFEGFRSKLLVNKQQLNTWQQMTLEKIYQSSKCNFEELKQYLKDSPFASILRTKFGRISRQDQLRVIKDLAILSDVDVIHLKEPSRFFLDYDIDQFTFGLDRPCVIESIQHCRFKSASWRIGIDGSINLQKCLPESIEDLVYFDSKCRFQAQLLQEDKQTCMKIGNLNFPLDSEQLSQLMGLMNQDLVIALNAQDFEVSKKQKSGFLKINIIKQSFRCGKWLQSLEVHDQILTRSSNSRSRTPFLYLRPDLRSSWIFSADSRKLVYPSSPAE